MTGINTEREGESYICDLQSVDISYHILNHTYTNDMFMNIIWVCVHVLHYSFKRMLSNMINTGECFVVIIRICTLTTIEEIANKIGITFQNG